MDAIKKIMDLAGIFQYGLVDTSSVKFENEVRKMCEINTCRKYNMTWACPPALGTVEECQKRIQQYDKMLVFSVKYDLEDSFDYDGMVNGMSKFKNSCRIINKTVKPYIKKYLLLGNEGCDLCKKCTYPDEPCRFPDQVHGSIEGYGIFVSKLAAKAKINYINGNNTVTYFGALVCNSDDIELLNKAENIDVLK